MNFLWLVRIEIKKKNLCMVTNSVNSPQLKLYCIFFSLFWYSVYILSVKWFIKHFLKIWTNASFFEYSSKFHLYLKYWHNLIHVYAKYFPPQSLKAKVIILWLSSKLTESGSNAVICTFTESPTAASSLISPVNPLPGALNCGQFSLRLMLMTTEASALVLRCGIPLSVPISLTW